MVSDFSPLDDLCWSQPHSRECSFEEAGWACRATGFLWFSEVRTGGEQLYPCPRCNTELFLKRAAARRKPNPLSPVCICCGPSLAGQAYESALETVRGQQGVHRPPSAL